MMTRAAFLELMYDRSVLQSLLFTTSPSDIFHVSTQTAKICKGCRFPLQWRFDSVGNIIIAVGFFARFIYASTEINKPGLDYHRINKPTVFFFLSHSLCPSSFVFLFYNKNKRHFARHHGNGGILKLVSVYIPAFDHDYEFYVCVHLRLENCGYYLRSFDSVHSAHGRVSQTHLNGVVQILSSAINVR